MTADFRVSRLFRSQPSIILLVIVVLAVAISLFNPVFLSVANLSIVLQQSSVTGIATMCMVLLMISGGLDFSIGSIISLSCVVMAKLIELKYGVGLTIVVGLGVATLCGLLNGFIVAKSRCPPIIITLGMLYIYYRIALNIAQGRFLNLMGKFEALGAARFLSIPYPVLQWLAVAICLFVLLKFTVFGRRLFSLGGNEEAAFLSGIKTGSYKIIAYTINGFISGIAALVLVSRLGSVISNVGADYALRALSAAVIGGVSFEGGRGSVGGAILGVVLLGIVYNAMNILGITSYAQNIVLGIIVVAAVVFSNIGKLRK